MKFMVLCEYALLRESFCNLLNQQQFGNDLSVTSAENMSEATRLIDSDPELDLLLSYVNIDTDGWASSLAALKRCCRQLPIMVVAEFRSEDEIRMAIAQGANGCVSTEFTWRAVTAVMQRILAGEIVSPSFNFELGQQHGDPQGGSKQSISVEKGVRRLNGQHRAYRHAEANAIHLTPRQLEVLDLVRRGKSNKEIARTLDLAEGTVKIHCVAIFRELGVTNRTQAAVAADNALM